MKNTVKLILGLFIAAFVVFNLTALSENSTDGELSLTMLRASAAPTAEYLIEYGFDEQEWPEYGDYTYHYSVDHADGSRSEATYLDDDGDGVMDSRYYYEYDSDGNLTSETVHNY